MDAETRANWLKIKLALEKANKTDSWYYKRAILILANKRDPFV